MIFNNYEESFVYFKRNKNRSDYATRNGRHYNHNTFYEEELVDSQIEFPPVEINGVEQHFGSMIVKDDAVDRFHPNNIDNKKFWKLSKRNFSLLSICGAKCNNYGEANKLNLKMSKDTGVFRFLSDNLKKNSNVLEIGYGYGNIFKQINSKCNYVGIDYTKPKFLEKHKNLLEIDTSGIPKPIRIKNHYDFLYSVNVLQHCSQIDRFQYFKQGYDVLKKGGYFIFTSFIMTEKNKNQFCWGIKDKDGRGYTQFFNQLTEVDYDNELKEYLEGLGFSIKQFSVLGYNNLVCLLQKK